MGPSSYSTVALTGDGPLNNCCTLHTSHGPGTAVSGNSTAPATTRVAFARLLSFRHVRRRVLPLSATTEIVETDCGGNVFDTVRSLASGCCVTRCRYIKGRTFKHHRPHGPFPAERCFPAKSIFEYYGECNLDTQEELKAVETLRVFKQFQNQSGIAQ